MQIHIYTNKYTFLLFEKRRHESLPEREKSIYKSPSNGLYIFWLFKEGLNMRLKLEIFVLVSLSIIFIKLKIIYGLSYCNFFQLHRISDS